MSARLTFLSHFLICLAVAAAAFFAHINGVFAAVWANDASHMTSAIGALFIGTAAWLGWQAWRVDAAGYVDPRRIYGRLQHDGPDASFGHLAERLAVIMGFVGTAIGLSLQAKALAGGAASFEALATSLFCTASGGLAAGLIAAMTYSLERGVKRSGR